MNHLEKIKSAVIYNLLSKRLIKAIRSNLESGSLSFDYLAKHTLPSLMRSESIVKFARRMVRDKKHAGRMMLKKFFKSPHGGKMLKYVLDNASPACKKGLVKNFLVNHLIIGNYKREKLIKKGNIVPFLLVLSPTMTCNLSCFGCYAGEYTKEKELDFKTVDRILTEAKKLGIYFITISGGEPFYWPHFLKILEKHNDIFFMVYTNGTLIDEKLAKKLSKLGNAMPAISVEGFEKETDARRGKGTFKKVMKAMDNLKKYGVIFGFSATLTKNNFNPIASSRFIDFYVKKGCVYGWYFLYVPIGKKPNINLMATPEQRLKLRNFTAEVRDTKPIFVGDFWNDGPFVDGCIAAGKNEGYLHITSKGDVEPCVFLHFAVDNIKNKSLKKAFNSGFFREIQKRQPYCENLLTPCALIDNPHIIREVVKKYNAKPTHPGADNVIKDKKVMKHLDDYSVKVKKLFEPLWQEKYKHGD